MRRGHCQRFFGNGRIDKQSCQRQRLRHRGTGAVQPVSYTHLFGARRRWVRRGLIACLFLFAVVWVVRMLLLFPHTPPMTADPGGILPRLTGALF